MSATRSYVPRKGRFFYGYLIVAAAFVVAATAWGSNRAYGVFLAPMLDEFGWTRAGISGVFTLNALVTGVAAIVAGRLTDRFGPRAVLLVCGLFLGLGYGLVSLVHSSWQFYLFYGILAGVGMGGAWAPLMSTVARWFVKRRSLMSGILTAGPAVGIVVFPVVSALVISAYGWRDSFIILGAVVVPLVLAGSLFLRRDPRDMDMMPYGAEASMDKTSRMQAQGLTFQSAVRTRYFWSLAMVYFCDSFLINAIVVHIVVYAQGMGISSTSAASVLSVAAGVGIPARVLTGAIGDALGNRRALAICLATALAAFGILLAAKSLGMLYAFAALYGVSLWATGGILSPLVAEFFGLKAHATLFGMVVLVGAIGGAVGPVAVGAIFDAAGSYTSAFVLCLAVNAASLLLVLSLFWARTWRPA